MTQFSNKNNYAFIDSQNLYLAIRDLGWKLDYKRFRIYLREKYNCKKVYMFMGYLAENQELNAKTTPCEMAFGSSGLVRHEINPWQGFPNCHLCLKYSIFKNLVKQFTLCITF